ncbi:hypothetical protein AAFF_G00143490 [Aldrovandia affinis]|uniref:Reverse transcriptase RNase H-like domain-containing protein n=1 Tax=Aldrovandia affinis TaxID=143900 RepID=A0AAD7T0D0_9TELE|nr:hypothetical protein AAFF_G00143490 [Aldrovandia affinis]
MTKAFTDMKQSLAPPNEWKYSTFDRELLGLYLAIRHFHFLLEACPFMALVDHRLLTFVMAKVSEPWSACQQRQLAFISEFTMDIQHVAGKDNAVASAVHLGVNYNRVAADQATDLDVQAYRTAVTGLKLVDVMFDSASAMLLCDVSTGHPSPLSCPVVGDGRFLTRSMAGNCR